jgi:hypothetical protein
MKATCCTIICLTALTLTPALAQLSPGAQPQRSTIRGGGGRGGFGSASSPDVGEVIDDSALTKFNLDFPGGTPKELVAAIQKAMARPLNAIVPDEFADTRLPALKMTLVNVAQLFRALEAASRKEEAFQTGRGGGFGGGGRSFGGSYTISSTACGFRTEGKPSDDSIWHFYVDKPGLPLASFPPEQPPKVCHFYSLAPYLDRGLSVDDITTAIQTGWKMLGDTSPPTISFHKETKLLIAVGEEDKLGTIDAALHALGSVTSLGTNQPTKVGQ